MSRFTIPTLLCCCCGLVASASAAEVQVFAAQRTAPAKIAAVETKPLVPAFATPERAAGPQVARSTPAVATPARASAVQPNSRLSTTFEPVMPAGAPTRSTAPQTTLVRSSTTSSAAITPSVLNKKQFTYTDPAGQVSSAEVLRGYQPKQIVSPIARIDPTIDPKLRRAATIAQERARAYTRRRCWRYVKEALLASGVIDSYPKTVNAKDAGAELVQSYGFKKLPIKDPYAAPVGSVLVYYKGRNRPGHVELRTKDGFVSDFRSKTPDRHALLGVFAKRG